MEELSKEQQEAYLQCIKANLKRAEDGSIIWQEDEKGLWNIVPLMKHRPKMTFFRSGIEGDTFDIYGNPTE